MRGRHPRGRIQKLPYLILLFISLLHTSASESVPKRCVIYMKLIYCIVEARAGAGGAGGGRLVFIVTFSVVA